MSPDVASLNQQFFTTKKILQQIKTLAPYPTGISRFHLYGQRQMILLINHQWENFSANNFLTQQKQARNGFVNDTVKKGNNIYMGYSHSNSVFSSQKTTVTVPCSLHVLILNWPVSNTLTLLEYTSSPECSCPLLSPTNTAEIHENL